MLFFDVSGLVLSVGEAGGAPVWLIARRSSSAKPSWLACAGRNALLWLRPVERLGCRRHVALFGQEVGALARPTSGHEAPSSGRKRAQLSKILAAGRGCASCDAFRRFHAQACVSAAARRELRHFSATPRRETAIFRVTEASRAVLHQLRHFCSTFNPSEAESCRSWPWRRVSRVPAHKSDEMRLSQNCDEVTLVGVGVESGR